MLKRYMGTDSDPSGTKGAPGTATPRDGLSMHELASRLFPICRSITGNGVRQTLDVLKEHLPDLRVHEVPSGTPCFDWTVPDEWNIHHASIVGPDGKKVVDFADCNLHVVGYSIPVDRSMTLSELQPHLHSMPHMPDAIPYVTSYYNRTWGFCLAHRRREALSEGLYRVRIDSTLAPGSLTYADLILPGDSDKEILISTYVCHPSMANNELSGPVVTTWLAKWLLDQQPRRYTHRFVFVPETIGSIVYINRHLEHLKKKVVAGFNVSCVGDDRSYSYLPSRAGNTISDKVARHVLRHRAPEHKTFSYLERGSDERQYCAPGVDLPIASVMRSKYGTYPEYHTSRDNLTLVTPSGLQGAYEALRDCLKTIGIERRYLATQLCEPQMGKRGLYSPFGTGSVEKSVSIRMDILCFCDGRHSLLDIAEILGMPADDLHPYFIELAAHGLIKTVEEN